MKIETQEYSPRWVLNQFNTCETDAHKLMVLVDFRHEIRKEENQWISMDERSPKNGEMVDIWLENLNRREPDVEFKDGRLYQDGKIFTNIGTEYVGVSHWMPLPEPPNNKSKR